MGTTAFENDNKETETISRAAEMISERIGSGKKVLFVGKDCRAEAERLENEKQCEVLFVDVDRDRYEISADRTHQTEDRFFESYEWKKELTDKYFDVIVFVNALEYIYDESRALETACQYLSDTGSLFIAVPYIGSSPALLELLKRRSTLEMVQDKYSPFEHYFTPATLKQLYLAKGLKPLWLGAVTYDDLSGASLSSDDQTDPAFLKLLENNKYGSIDILLCELKRSDFFDRTGLTTTDGLPSDMKGETDLLSAMLDEISDGQKKLAAAKKEVFEKEIHIRNIESQTIQKDAYIKAIEPAYREYLNLRGSKWVQLRDKLPDKAAKRALSTFKHKEYPVLAVPQSDQPLVSVVIPVYNQFDYTYDCVKSIVGTVRDIPYEIIIGDDESKDDTRRIRKIMPGVEVNINRSEHGFVMNCKRAAEKAKGKYLVFLNNDTVVKENWLSSLVAVMEKDPKAGLVGSKLVYDEEHLQEAGGIIWQDATGWNYGRNQTKFGPEYNYIKEVDYVSGASMMIRKSLWDEIGGFDERFIPAYYEDTDLAFSVRKAGYKVIYQPRSEVIHFEGISNGTDTEGSGLKAYQEVNRAKFAEKWKDELTKQYPDPTCLFKARERGQNKKTVLFIDHYVPNIDKDAGSKSTFSYIRIFLHMGYSVKFIGDNWQNPEPYTTMLQDLGVEVLYGLWYELNWQRWLKENGRNIDVVFANRPHITIKYIDALKDLTDARIIYYGHDLHYIRTRREYEITKDETKLKESRYWKSIEYEIMSKADVVFYPSYVEIGLITGERPELKDKARAIPVYMFEALEEERPLPSEERKDLLFVGGFNHSPNIDAAIWFVNDIWPDIQKAHPDINFHIVGSHPTDEVLALASDHVIVHGFVSDERLIELYHTSRIVIAPLRYGAGMKGKIVEALYYQEPVVTTTIGAEGMPEADNVLIVEDDAEKTADILIRLYTDYAKLDEMSEKTRTYIDKYFSERAAAAIVKEML